MIIFWNYSGSYKISNFLEKAKERKKNSCRASHKDNI